MCGGLDKLVCCLVCSLDRWWGGGCLDADEKGYDMLNKLLPILRTIPKALRDVAMLTLILGVLALIVSILQLQQGLSSVQEQATQAAFQQQTQGTSVALQQQAQATLVDVLNKQLKVQSELATLQASNFGVGPTATAIARQQAQLKSTEEALKNAQAQVFATATAFGVPRITATLVGTPVAKCEKMPGALLPRSGELGSSDKPIVITFVPSVDVSLITKGGSAMAECLSKITGLSFKVEVGTSEAASIEALGSTRAQIGFLNTFSILLAKQKYDTDVALIAQRKYGALTPSGAYTAFDFDPDKAMAGQLTSYYKPEYFTRVGSGIKTLADVKGKSFCFVAASSISGGIVPRVIFRSIDIDPDKDVKSVYAGTHGNVAIAVYRGDCDAGVAFIDVLTDKATNLVAVYPDIAQKVHVFAVGDRVPNDGVVFAKGFDTKIKTIIVDALFTMMSDPGGNIILKSIYNYDAFEKTDYNKYYAPFADLLKRAGVDVGVLVRQ
jgi:phosphonate transport system substrate-binding protein